MAWKTGLCLGICLAAGALAPPTFAAEWFVSPTGSDAPGSGSLAQPFKTLGYLLAPDRGVLTAGDTITLRGPSGNNVYPETELRLRLPLTLQSYPGEWAVIQCPLNLENGVCIQIDPEASGSRISRLEVTGGNLYGIFMQTEWDSGNNRGGRGASNIVIEDCKIHDTGRDAIKITPKSDDITIRRCEIYNTGRIYPAGTPLDEKNAEGIDNVNGSRMRVEDCFIHDIATNGLYFKGGAADVIVERNRIERTGEGGIMVGYDTSPEYFDTAVNPQYYESIRGTVRNNVIRDTGYAGIGLYAARDALVANNTLVHTATSGHAAIYFGVTLQDFDPIAGRPPTVNPLIRNNLVIQNGGDCVRVRWANEITEAGLYSLQGNPGTDYNWFHNESGACNFADNRPGSPLADGGSFAQWQSAEAADVHSQTGSVSVTADGHLPAGSPAIDQGQTLTQVTDDIDRQPRSGAYDIGADEAGGGGLPGRFTVWEFHNSIIQHYFIAASEAEAAGIDQGAAGPGWSRTGQSFLAYPLNSEVAGLSPVCRFYGTPGIGPNSHFYTANAGECEWLKTNPGLLYEGLAFRIATPSGASCANGGAPVYRLYNGRWRENDSNHRYTTDAALYTAMQAQGWTGEGVVFCAAI
ncbi:MAG: right-handed parallel beta-helix repeat-containing protein [Betaproteobacteria bacterium]|nr:right-handed parallel beta-helix repeat-containing protein [Betaproteobacteria bacterium]